MVCTTLCTENLRYCLSNFSEFSSVERVCNDNNALWDYSTFISIVHSAKWKNTTVICIVLNTFILQLTSKTNTKPTLIIYKTNSNEHQWYFVTKIVLTHCEKKLFYWSRKLLKFEAEGQEFAKFLRSLEQFIQAVKGQNNFW